MCHCARSVKVVVGNRSAEAPFELEYADEEGSGSSDGLNHLGQGSSEYFEPCQVPFVVEKRNLLRVIDDSPEPAGLSDRPCVSRHFQQVHTACPRPQLNQQ